MGIHPEKIGGAPGEGYVTIYISEDSTGQGIGPAALREAVAEYCKARRKTCLVRALVRSDNGPSLKMFKRVGFRRDGNPIIRGVSYVRLRATGLEIKAADLESVFEKFRTTAATSYSTVRGRPAFLRQELAYFDEMRRRTDPRTVVDGTAHVGVDTTILARSFPDARAVERPRYLRAAGENMAITRGRSARSTGGCGLVPGPHGPVDLVYLDPGGGPTIPRPPTSPCPTAWGGRPTPSSNGCWRSPPGSSSRSPTISATGPSPTG